LIVAGLRHAPDVMAQAKFHLALRSIVTLAACISVGYAVANIWHDMKTDQRALVHFGTRARAIADANGGTLAVVSGKDEGMLLYTRTTRFTRFGDAVDQWKAGAIDWLVLPGREFQNHARELGPSVRILESGKIEGKNSDYVLLRR